MDVFLFGGVLPISFQQSRCTFHSAKDHFMKTICGLAFVVLCTSSSLLFADSAINAWTNPASGNWQDLKWSLGIRPGLGQTIMLTNHGWKAIAISPSTVQNFSASLDISSITLGGYTDSFNLLLLN